MSGKFYTEKKITDWDQIRDFSKPSETNWIYRGQSQVAWDLETKLERSCREWGLSDRAKEMENKVHYEFRRRAHGYVSSTPQMDDTLEWLSLIQHYGGPTRLLDWTFSIWIAVFFAIESASSDSALWIIDAKWLDEESRKIIEKEIGGKVLEEWIEKRTGKSFDQIFIEKNIRFVHRANPHRLNDRLSVQQGLFLTQGDVNSTFLENLLALPDPKSHVTKVVIPKGCREKGILNLHRMGITAESLFPGLDGFARSLSNRLSLLARIDIKLYV